MNKIDTTTIAILGNMPYMVVDDFSFICQVYIGIININSAPTAIGNRIPRENTPA